MGLRKSHFTFDEIFCVPEYLKRVYAIQFLITDEEKQQIMKGGEVYFDGQRIKHAGTERFHVLLNRGEVLVPLYENQWLVRDSGDLEIYWDTEFKAKFQLLETQSLPIEEVLGKFDSEIRFKKPEKSNYDGPAISGVDEFINFPNVNGHELSQKSEV